jgi:heterodisulfide reductase subunit C
MAKLDKELEALNASYETRVTEITTATQDEAASLRGQRLAELQDFGRSTENETVAVVFCVKCGHVAGVCPNPTATRFNEKCEALKCLATTAEKGNTELVAMIRQLVADVQASNSVSAEQHASIIAGFNMLAQILTTPTTTTSVSMEL